MMTRTLILSAALAASGCGASESNAKSVKVYKSRGAIQCTSQGTPPEEMSRELVSAGVPVLSYACGTNGRLYPAMCGTSDDKINIFEIPDDKLDKAVALSFQPLSNLPEAGETNCP